MGFDSRDQNLIGFSARVNFQASYSVFIANYQEIRYMLLSLG